MHPDSDAVNCGRRQRAVTAARAGALVLLLPALLLAVAALPAFPVEDETPRFQFNLDSARDAIRVIARELNRFDGQSGPSTDLEEAAGTFGNQMSILRENADRHTLAPPSLGGIVTACAEIEQPSLYDGQLAALRRMSDREVEEFKIHTSAFLQTRTALNQLVANRSLELWMNVLPAPKSLDKAVAANLWFEGLFGVFSAQEGFPAGSYVERHQAELTRRMHARAKATGLTDKSPHIGKVFAAYKELALLAKENYERSERLVKAYEDQRRAIEERAAQHEKVKAEYLALCDRITSEPGWRPGSPTPPTPTPPALTPSPTPIPPTVVPPPGPVEVPHITGWARENAEREIQGAGLDVGPVTTAASNHVPAGSVIDQSPVGGTRVAPGTAIALVLSRGPSQPGQLIIEPASVDLELGETVEFAAKAVYDDGSVQYFTYGSTWTPGPDHKFTATRAGTYTITATFQGLTGRAVVRVGRRDFTPSVLPPDGTDLPEAPPQEYTWYALCRPSDGEVSYGQRVNVATHRILGGPFPGPRSTRSWIDEQCPSWRCTSSGLCSQGQPTGGDGMGDWFVLCNPQSGAVGVSTNRHAPGQRAMAGPFLGEPEARSWIGSSCPSWRCTSSGVCSQGQPSPGDGVGDWFVLCNPQSGAVGVSTNRYAPGQRAMAGPFLGEPEARSWIGSSCPSWRCTSSGACSQGQPSPGDGVGDWFVMCNPQSRAVGVSTNRHAPGQRAMAGPFLGEPEARSWMTSNCPSWLCDANGACAAGTTPGTGGGNWPTGPVSGDPPGGGGPGPWGSGPIDTITAPQPTPSPEPIPSPPPTQDATPFIEGATREAAACRYPAALSYADQLAQAVPGHPWLTANHGKLRDLARRQKAAIQEMKEGQARFARKDYYGAGKAAERAAQHAPSCMRDLIESFGETARQDFTDDWERSNEEQRKQREEAAELLPGLIDLLEDTIEARNPQPRPRDGGGPPTGGKPGPKPADPCETEYTYLNKWNPEPRCDCSGYKWNGYKCVPGPGGGPRVPGQRDDDPGGTGPRPKETCSCKVDESGASGPSNICDTFLEKRDSQGRLDPAGKNVVIHIVNADRGKGWRAPQGWRHGLHNECTVLSKEMRQDCVSGAHACP